MSKEYDLYLDQHKENVRKGFYWLKHNLPELLKEDWDEDGNIMLEYQICELHDKSKYDIEEYLAYDNYFYSNNRSYHVVEDFRFAWLRHIHYNPHHWQHWVLINDDPNEGEIIMDMPYRFIIEMICDWWAFSWAKGDLREIFKWFDERKDYMKLSKKTRKVVESILEKIHVRLDEKETSNDGTEEN